MIRIVARRAKRVGDIEGKTIKIEGIRVNTIRVIMGTDMTIFDIEGNTIRERNVIGCSQHDLFHAQTDTFFTSNLRQPSFLF
jgi:hypothetical protein